MFVRTWGYTLTHRDPSRPWIVLERTHHTVDLPDDVWFGEWVGSRWLSPEWDVELDPGLHMEWVRHRLGHTTDTHQRFSPAPD